MHKQLIGALVANSAALGFHWIYDPTYLELLSKKESLLFQKQEKRHYNLAKISYYSYPNSSIGSFTLQGNILKWLYKALESNPNMTKNDYEIMLYNYLKPGGSYEGYVESYTKKMIIENLSKELNIDYQMFPKLDDHLVSFMPYIASKLLNLSNDFAWELAKLFSFIDSFPVYYKMFDYILLHINNMPMNALLKKAIKLAPDIYYNQLEAALTISDTQSFIHDHAGIACQIPQSIPLIIHLLNKDLTYEDTIEFNVKLGGASSDRGLILGFILSSKYKVPTSWINKTNLSDL